MSDYKDKLSPLCQMSNVLVEALHGELTRGVECVDTEEVGEVSDIIKDLAQTQKYICEAEYYKHVIEAMQNGSDDRDNPYSSAYNDYKIVKNHYMKTHSIDDRNKMDKFADVHISKAIESIKEIWEDAEPMLKEEIRDNLSELLKEMA